MSASTPAYVVELFGGFEYLPGQERKVELWVLDRDSSLRAVLHPKPSLALDRVAVFAAQGHTARIRPVLV